MRTRTAILLAVALLVTLFRRSAGAQELNLEQQLDALAKKGYAAPAVAVVSGPGENPTKQAASLDELAGRYGLKLFDQDGVCVLAPAERPDLAAIISPGPPATELPTESGSLYLLATLTPEQLRAAGSPVGLHYNALGQDQRRLLHRMFGKTTVLMRGFPDPEGELGVEPQIVPATSLPVSQIAIHVSVRLLRATVYSTGGDITGAEFYEQDMEAERCWLCTNCVEGMEDSTELPVVPNALKPSHLDYGLPELCATADFGGRISLSDLIVRAARLTGLKLVAPAGSKDVMLFVQARQRPIGSILKAVSLATGGTWRRVGEVYVFAPDMLGLGQVAARSAEQQAGHETDQQNAEKLTHTAEWRRGFLTAVPFDASGRFELTEGQLQRLLDRQAVDDPEGQAIPWGMLTPEQQALTSKAVAGQSGFSEGIEGITPRAYAGVTFAVPGFGTVLPSLYFDGYELCPPPDDLFNLDILFAPAPAGASVSLTSPIRALLLKPGRSDTPSAVTEMMQKHGLNTLFLRVFSDGYAVFPTEQFPRRAWSAETDYLARMIEAAHGKGIRVFAVVDVLRWSDGSKSHWLRKNPQLLDYDILGRTSSERGVGPNRFPEAAAILQAIVSDAYQGDAVTPFEPEVARRENALLAELVKYPLDGLALDYTLFRRPDSVEFFDDSSTGETGYAEAARYSFIKSQRMDPIDIPPGGVTYPLDCLQDPEEPLAPAISCLAQAQDQWRLFYRNACDDLLDGLLTTWKDIGKDRPVWVVDTFGDPADTGSCHDWARFKGRVEGVLNILAMDQQDYPGHGIKRALLLRPCDSIGSLLIASLLAQSQGRTFPGMISEEDMSLGKAKDGIAFDFTLAVRKKAEFLRMLKPPTTER